MKRPLFAVTMLLFAVAWLNLIAGGYAPPPDCSALSSGGYTEKLSSEDGQTICISGKICHKEETKIWLDSVIILNSEYQGIYPNQEELNQENLYHENLNQENLNQGVLNQGSSNQRNLYQGSSNQKEFTQDNKNQGCWGNGNSYPEKIICEFSDEFAELPMGCRVVVTGTYNVYSQATNPGEFDSFVYYRSLGVGGRLSATEVLAHDDERWPVREAAFQLRQLLSARLKALLPEETAQVMCALLLGEKSGMDQELKALYKRNGILHILSISSLHITIIGMSLYHLLRRAGMPVIPAALAGGLVLVFYGCMTGFGVSVCRSIGMYLLRMLAEILGRTYDMLTALGILALLMVLYNPYYLQNVGFLLSFTAVAGIGMIYPLLEEREKITPRYLGETGYQLWLRRSMQNLRNAVAANLSITLMTLPIQLWFYYEIPTCSLIINLLVLPFMKPLLIAGFLCLLPGFGWLGGIDRGILKGYELLCELFDGLPFRTWNPGSPRLLQVVIYYGLLFGLVVFLQYIRKKCRGENYGSAIGNAGAGVEKDRAENSGVQTDRTGKIGAEKGRAGKAGVEKGRVENGRRFGFHNRRLRTHIVRENAGSSKGARLGFRCHTIGMDLLQYFICLVTVCTMVVIIGIHMSPGNRIIFMDVGQGDCALVQTSSGENYLIDCGSSSRKGVGQYILIPCLKYYGIRQLDAVFLTHADNDHMNGILELLELAEENQVSVRQLVLPAIDRERRKEEFEKILSIVEMKQTADCAGDSREEISNYIEAAREQSDGMYGQTEDTKNGVTLFYGKTKMDIRWLKAGDKWQCKSGYFVCMHPSAGYCTENSNAYSLCLYGRLEKMDFLFTGDVEGEGEQELIHNLCEQQISRVTILKCAHHGSRNATSEEFLRQVKPLVTVVSCGRKNRYGHPHSETLERLAETGTAVYRTDELGAIEVYLKKEKIEIVGYGKR
ncbi:MAG: ComEC/Rec2 family competence protein [Acetatifactor sp.]